MNITSASAEDFLAKPSHQFSADGRERLLSLPGEPLFLADWQRALFIHYEVDAALLQRELPFALDLWHGKAFVSLVAFTMRDMHPRFGGRTAAWLFKPISTHGFLNARTYVKHGDERGIYFITEWLSNRLSVALGPSLYGLPYRFAKLDYSVRAKIHPANRLHTDLTAHQARDTFHKQAGLALALPPCQTAGLARGCAGNRTNFVHRPRASLRTRVSKTQSAWGSTKAACQFSGGRGRQAN
jgi:uncharacterized protein YqjF (DUF2071 family)